MGTKSGHNHVQVPRPVCQVAFVILAACGTLGDAASEINLLYISSEMHQAPKAKCVFAQRGAAARHTTALLVSFCLTQLPLICNIWQIWLGPAHANPAHAEPIWVDMRLPLCP